MTILSKVPCMESTSKLSYCDSVPYTCYEFGHTWNTSCFRTYVNVFKTAMAVSLKLYGSLYMLGFLLRLRKKKKNVRKMLINLFWEIQQSSIFLSMNATYFLMVFCAYGKIFNCYHGYSGVIVGIVCSALSIILERKSRRGLLAVYVANLGVETFFNMLVSRGLIKSIPNGEVYLFCLSSSVYMSMFRNGTLPTFVRSLLANMFGTCEISGDESQMTTTSMNAMQYLPKSIQSMCGNVDKRVFSVGGCHRCCNHKEACTSYVLKGTLRNFGIGFLIQSVLNLRAVLKLVVKRDTRRIFRLFRNLSLAKFLGAYTFIFRAINCLLRRFVNSDSPAYFGLMSGFAAGFSSLFYKSSTLSMYLSIKLIEILCMKAVEAKKLPYIRHLDSILYSLCLGIIFHAAIFEPHNLRPAYWKFLCDLSGNRFKEMFRIPIDVFGSNASKLYPNFVPALDPRLVKSEAIKQVLISHGKWSGTTPPL